MAVRIPTAIIALDPLYFRRSFPICSGDASADEPYGWRGLNSQINHGYAYRSHSLTSMGHPDADSTPVFTTTSTSFVLLSTGMYGVHHMCGDVTQLVLEVDSEQAFVQLDFNGTTSASSTGTTTRATESVTLTIAGGDAGTLKQWHIKLKAQSGQTAKVYRLAVTEVVLASLP